MSIRLSILDAEEQVGPRLLTIAQISRQAITNMAKDHEKIHGWCGIDVNDLACGCAVASRFLQRLAREYGYALKLIEGVAFVSYRKPKKITRGDINHCWNTYQDSIIDITATQFDRVNDVYIVPISSKDYQPFTVNSVALRNINSTVWPDTQRPSYYNLRPYLEWARNELKSKLK